MHPGVLSDDSIRRECPEMFSFGFHVNDTRPYIPRTHKFRGIKGPRLVQPSFPLAPIHNIISAASFGGRASPAAQSARTENADAPTV